MTETDRKYIALIGTPLDQSFAARMQNRAYEAMGVNFHYTCCEAGTEHLGEIVTGIRFMPNYAGFAVTKPNKVKVLEYLDALDPMCKKIGACNTVVKSADGKLTGFNTDAEGFGMSLMNIERDKENAVKSMEKVFCIGSGGAARAISFALAEKGCEKIYLCSEHGKSAKRLAEDINAFYPGLAGAEEKEKISECDMIINASGVGMGESAGESPVSKELLHPGQLCFDACYNPEKTRFLLDAEEQGCRIMNGLEMSLYQGARQIELWTGRRAPVELMREEIIRCMMRKA